MTRSASGYHKVDSMNSVFQESISVVMPVYDEEDCIESVIFDIYQKIINRFQDAELIVVNDGSQDKTREILTDLESKYKNLTVIYQGRCGHGKAIMKGYQSARKDWIFQLDSDDQFDIQDFWKLWDVRNSSPIILGYRKKREDATIRLIVTRILRIIILIFFDCSIPDANIPFRLFSRKIFVDRIFPKIPSDTLLVNAFMCIVFYEEDYHPTSITVFHKEREGERPVIIGLWWLVLFCLRSLGQLVKFWILRNKHA